MTMFSILEKETMMLLQMNQFIYRNPSSLEYHMEHIKLAKEYAFEMNRRLGSPVSYRKLSFAALFHDLLKEKGLHPDEPNPMWLNHEIPQDLNRYVRMNLDVLAEYGIDDYFNTDVQYHALSAGLFLIKELNITDQEIIYPIMFHSCPIMPVYQTLDATTKTMVDIMMLSDKLSSNYLRINMREVPVRVDLDLLVFGKDRKEFNYTTGLYIARMIGHGHSNEKNGKDSLAYYYDRAKEQNPFLSKKIMKGDTKLWPKRKNPLWKYK